MRSAQILQFPFREKARDQAVVRQVDDAFKKNLKTAEVRDLLEREISLRHSDNVHAPKRRQFIIDELASRNISFYEKGEMPQGDFS